MCKENPLSPNIRGPPSQWKGNSSLLSDGPIHDLQLPRHKKPTPFPDYIFSLRIPQRQGLNQYRQANFANFSSRQEGKRERKHGLRRQRGRPYPRY